MSQDITVLISGTAPSIPPMALNAIINQQASLLLPKLDASFVYSISSKQTFAASIDGT
jgi:hypothetical protein